MTHRHEWRFNTVEQVDVFELGTNESIFQVLAAIATCECGAQMGPTQMERRLNATMALSAEDTKLMEQWLFLFSQGTQNDVVKRLVDVAGDYARILEGGDE